MPVREIVARHLAADYGGAALSDYCESGDEFRFRLPARLVDPQAAAFQSRDEVLNELSISHGLSVSIGRRRYGLSDETALSMKSLESLARSISFAPGCDLSMGFEAVTNRRGTVTAFRSTLVTKCGTSARTTSAAFDILPPSLAKFLGRERQFSDCDDAQITADQPGLSAVGEGHFRYCPSDRERVSNGRPLEHVPALTLIDLALIVQSQACPGDAWRNVSAEFLNYTDPRRPFEIRANKGSGAVEFAQDGRPVAIVTLAISEGS